MDIKAIDAKGHTPGHVVYQKDDLLIIGDLIHGLIIQLSHPEICASYDHDEEESISARRRVMEYAKKNKLFIAGMHLPFSRSSLFGDWYYEK